MYHKERAREGWECVKGVRAIVQTVQEKKKLGGREKKTKRIKAKKIERVRMAEKGNGNKISFPLHYYFRDKIFHCLHQQ